MHDIQSKTYGGGMNKDVANIDEPGNQYQDANDIQHVINKEDGQRYIQTANGNHLVFEIESLEEFDQRYDIVFNQTDQNITVIQNGISFVVQSSQVDPNDWLADITTQLQAGLTDETLLDSGFQNVDGLNFFYWVFSFPTENAIVITPPTVLPPGAIAANYYAYIIKDFYDVSGGPSEVFMYPFASKQILDDLFIFSSNNSGTVGELGVAKKNNLTGVWTYVRLIRSNKFNFNLVTTFDVDGEGIVDGQVALYFTDNVNTPRVLYIKQKQVYQTDQMLRRSFPLFLVTDNPDGNYILNTFQQAMELQVYNNQAQVQYVSTNDGGQLTAGGKRFIARFGIGDVAFTGWSQLSGLVNIAIKLPPDSQAQGDIGGTITDKSITIQVVNCEPQLFTTIEIAMLEYAGGAVSGYIVGSYDITGPTFTVTITGFENSSSPLDLSTITDLSIKIATSKNLEIHDNRLFIGNTTQKTSPDLSTWFASLSASLTETVTELDAIASDFSTISEFYLGSNNFNYIGYMPNETYRFAGIVHWKDGSVSPPYYIGDYSFSGNMHVTDSQFGAPTKVRSIGLRISTIDLSSAPVIDGIPFEELAAGISIVRAECIPEVLAMGILMPATHNQIPGYYGGGSWAAYGIPGINTYPDVYDGPSIWGPLSPYLFLYGFFSPDLYFNQAAIQNFLPGDIIYNYGAPYPYVRTATTILPPPDPQEVNYYTQYNGWALPAPDAAFVEDVEYVGFNALGIRQLSTDPGAPMSKYATWVDHSNTDSGCCSIPSLGMRLNTAVTGFLPSGNVDYGLYMAQYFRPRPQKYGDPVNTQYIGCNHLLLFSSGITIYNNVDVYGGDTFAQRTYVKVIYRNADYVTTPDTYRKGGISYYSYNRMNTQMRRVTTPTVPTYPINTFSLTDWLAVSTQFTQEDTAYDSGYTPDAGAQQYPAFNAETNTLQSITPTRVYYSQVKPVNSLQDSYRVILPLDFKDYQLKYGEINEMFSRANGLLIMQPNQVSFQLVNPDSVVTSEQGLPTTLGAGGVLSTREQFITEFGVSFKTGALRYNSGMGGLSFSWFNKRKRKFVRLGADGIKMLSDTNGIRSWFFDHEQYIVAERDINMAYDQKKEEILITAKGRYVDNPQQFWWTLSYNERIDAFSTFNSFKPNYYFEYDNTILTPGYAISAGDAFGADGFRVYEHSLDDVKPYFYGYTPLNPLVGILGNPYVTDYVNKQPLVDKRPLTLFLNSNNVPRLVEYTDYFGNQTTSINTDFNLRRDYYIDLIKNINAPGSGKMRSKFIKTTIYFGRDYDIPQKIYNIVMKFIYKYRPFNL